MLESVAFARLRGWATGRQAGADGGDPQGFGHGRAFPRGLPAGPAAYSLTAPVMEET